MTRKKCDHVAPLNGTCVDDAAVATPGTDPISRVSWSWNAAFRSAGRPVRRTFHERNHERAFGLEAGWHRGEVAERLHEEQCREDEHERQRDLRDDEPALESRAMAIDGGAARRRGA